MTTTDDESGRVPGKIEGFSMPGPEDHGMIVSWLHLAGDGWGQRFGGIILKDKDRDLSAEWVAEICATFGVRTFADLAGLPCIALYSEKWGRLGSTIEGVETVHTGKRFTLTGFRRRHFDPGYDKLADRRAAVLRSIEFHEREAREERVRLPHLAANFIDWERP